LNGLKYRTAVATDAQSRIDEDSLKAVTAVDERRVDHETLGAKPRQRYSFEILSHRARG
jgi:hypothetical protein